MKSTCKSTSPQQFCCWELRRCHINGTLDPATILLRGKTTIGRGLNNTLLCKSLFASKNHCAILLYDNGLIFIKDFQSLNGTFLGQEKIIANRDMQLHDGDVIGIGVEVTDVSDNFNTIFKLSCRVLKEDEVTENTSRSMVPYLGCSPPLALVNNNETLNYIKLSVGEILHMGPPPTLLTSTPDFPNTSVSNSSAQDSTLKNDPLTKSTVNYNSFDTISNTPTTSNAPINPLACFPQPKIIPKTERVCETIELSSESDEEDVKEFDDKQSVQEEMKIEQLVDGTDQRDVEGLNNKQSVQDLMEIEQLVDETNREDIEGIDDEHSVQNLTEIKQLVDETNQNDIEVLDDEHSVHNLKEIKQLVDETNQNDIEVLDDEQSVQDLTEIEQLGDETNQNDIEMLDDKQSVQDLKEIEQLVETNQNDVDVLDDKQLVQHLTEIDQLVDKNNKVDGKEFDNKQSDKHLMEIEQLVDENVISIESDNEDIVQDDVVELNDKPDEAISKNASDNDFVLELSVSDGEELHLSDNDLESACVLVEKELEKSTTDDLQDSGNEEAENMQPGSASPQLIDTIFENEEDAEIIPSNVLLNHKTAETNDNELPNRLKDTFKEVAQQMSDILVPGFVEENDKACSSKQSDCLKPLTMTSQPDFNCLKELPTILNIVSKSPKTDAGESSKEIAMQSATSVGGGVEPSKINAENNKSNLKATSSKTTHEDTYNTRNLCESKTASGINATTNKINMSDPIKSSSNNVLSSTANIVDKPRKRVSEIDDTIEEIFKRRLSSNKLNNLENAVDSVEKKHDDLGKKHFQENETRETDSSVMSFTMGDDDDIILVEDDLPCSQMFSVKEEENVNQTVEEDIQDTVEAEEEEDDASVSSADEWLQLLSQGNTVDNTDNEYNDNDLELIDESDEWKEKKEELFSEDEEYMVVSDNASDAASSATKEGKGDVSKNDNELNKKDGGDNNINVIDIEEQVESSKVMYVPKTSTKQILCDSDNKGNKKEITVDPLMVKMQAIESQSKLKVSTLESKTKSPSSDEEDNFEVEVIKPKRILGSKRKLEVSSDEEVSTEKIIKGKNNSDSSMNKLSPEVKIKKVKHFQIKDKSLKDGVEKKTSTIDKAADIDKSSKPDTEKREKSDTKSKKTYDSSKPSSVAKKHKKSTDSDSSSGSSSSNNKKLKLVNFNDKNDISGKSNKTTSESFADTSEKDVTDSKTRGKPEKSLKKKKRQSSTESGSGSDRSQSTDGRPKIQVLPDIMEGVEEGDEGSSTGSSGDWEGLVSNIVASIDQKEDKTEKSKVESDVKSGDEKKLKSVIDSNKHLGLFKSSSKASTSKDKKKREDDTYQRLKSKPKSLSNEGTDLDAVSKKIMASHKKSVIPIIDPKSLPMRRRKSIVEGEEMSNKDQNQESTSDKWLSNDRKQIKTVNAPTSTVELKAIRKEKLKVLAIRESASNVMENKQKPYTSAKNTTKITSKSRNEIFLDTLVSKESSSTEAITKQENDSKKIKSINSFKIPRRPSKNEETTQKSVVNTSITEENAPLKSLPPTITKGQTLVKPIPNTKAISSKNAEVTPSNSTENSKPIVSLVDQILTDQISNSVSNKVKTRVARVPSKSIDGVENEEPPRIIVIPDEERPLRNVTNVPLKPIIRVIGSGAVRVKTKKKVAFNRPGDDNVLYIQVREFEIEAGNALKVPTKNMVKKDKPPPKEIGQKNTSNAYHTSYWEELIQQITKWNTLWFEEKNNVKGEPPGVFDGQTYHLSVDFTSYNEYRRGFYPLLLFENWQSLAKQHDLVQSRSLAFNIEIMSMKEMEVKNQFVPKQREHEKRKYNRLECQVLLDRDNSFLWPRLGDLVVLDVKLLDPKKETLIPRRLLAYIATGQGVRPITTRSNISPKLKLQCPKATQMMNFTLYTKCSMFKIVTEKETRLVVLKNIKSDLREFEALDRLPASPLMPMILQPKANDAAIPPVELKHVYQPNAYLNPSQKKAVVNVAKASSSNLNMIHLIHGPPGCGKSEVIIGIIQQMWNDWFNKQAPCPRILLCAPSNAAIDDLFFRLMNIRQSLRSEDRDGAVNLNKLFARVAGIGLTSSGKGLEKKFNMVRIGRTDMTHWSVSSMTLDYLVEKELKKAQELIEDDDHRNIELVRLEAKKNSLSYQLDNPGVMQSKKSVNYISGLQTKLADTIKKIKQLESGGQTRNGGLIDQKELREKKKETEMNLLENAHIIATTLSSCYNTQMEQAHLAKRLQLTCCIVDESTQCTEPETLIPLMLGIRSLVLVGDPQQLPATVISSTAKDHGMGRSLFARQHEWWQQNLARDPSLTILYNTRCHFLDTQYRMHPAIAQWPSEYFYNKALQSHFSLECKSANFPLKPYTVLSHNFQQSRQEECNYDEALMVVKLVIKIQSNPHCERLGPTIGVITPYNQQRSMIKNHLEKQGATGVEVGTVDSYQGRERDVIILSCVRTEGVGFMSGPERLNVALTRAKHSLIICGNFRSLQSDPTWASLLENAKCRGVFKPLGNCDPTSPDLLREIVKHDFYQ